MADGNAMGWGLYIDTALPFGLRSAPKVIHSHCGCCRVGGEAGQGGLRPPLPG